MGLPLLKLLRHVTSPVSTNGIGEYPMYQRSVYPVPDVTHTVMYIHATINSNSVLPRAHDKRIHMLCYTHPYDTYHKHKHYYNIYNYKYKYYYKYIYIVFIPFNEYKTTAKPYLSRFSDISPE